MKRESVRTVARELRTLYDVGATAGLTDGQLLERFATRGGEAAELAFAALVERHGPMVLRTCGGVLRDEHDALDAFQATFLILARKGETLWVRDSLGPWLHRVACRVAVHVKRVAARRRAAERRAAELAAPSEGEANRGDIASVLHEEIDRLPDRYRIPIVLCDLDGRTHEEVARHLRCPVGTVKSRLARGREQLRGRLCRRGLAPSAGILAAAALSQAASAGPSRSALEAATRAALEATTGKQAAAEAAGAHARSLADEVLRSLVRSRLKRGVASVLAAAIVCAGAGRLAGWSSGAQAVLDRPPQREQGPAQAAPRPEDAPAAARQGREKVAEEERRVPPFDEIRVVGKIRVVVEPGPDHRVTAVGDAGRLRALRSRVEKQSERRRLLLELSPPEGGREEIKAGDAAGVDVRIITPRLSGAIAEGGAIVRAHALKNKSLSLTACDTAKIEVSGSSDSLTAVLRDSGRLDASRLDAGQANVTASEQASGAFRAREALNVMSSGDASVEYVGTPAQLNQILSGRSRLIRR